jgi:hypothetical protein
MCINGVPISLITSVKRTVILGNLTRSTRVEVLTSETLKAGMWNPVLRYIVTSSPILYLEEGAFGLSETLLKVYHIKRRHILGDASLD